MIDYMIPEKPLTRCNKHPLDDIVFIKEDGYHYGRWNCANPSCNKYVCWAKKPQTDNAMKERQARILRVILDLTDPLKQVNEDDLKTLLEMFSSVHPSFRALRVLDDMLLSSIPLI